jgi:hypothetical protein
MTMVSFSDSDLLRNKIVEPAWYVLDIQAHRTWSPTKDGQSNNCHFECVIIKNADNGADDFAAVPIELQFNDKPKAKGFIEGFLRGLGVDIQANARYSLESAVGKKIEAFIENDTYNGRIINRCNHKYRQLREAAQQ